MKLYKRLLLSFLLAIPLGASVAQDDEIQLQSFLLRCPNEILAAISSYLEAQENLTFRQTCKVINECVDDSYQWNLEKESNIFLKRDYETASLLPSNYLKSLLKSILQKDGYLFTPQGSDLEKYLYRHYIPISLYPFLQEDMAWTQELFQTLFGRPIPQDKTELALKLFTACLPINRIYSTQEEDPSIIIQKFKENHYKSLITALKTMNQQHSYFLVGIDDDKGRLITKPHFIVVTQSDMSDIHILDQEGYLPENNPHTLIYNADQKVLTSPQLPQYIGKLIFINGDNQCTFIEDFFYPEGCIGLRSIELSTFSNLMSIGDQFLMTNFQLTSVKFGVLPNLTSIGRNFLSQCYALTDVGLGVLPNLTSIGDFFLYRCDRLTSMNLDGLSNVTSIGDNFLWGCEGLTTVDLSRLSNAAHTVILKNGGLHRLGLAPQDETGIPQTWIKQQSDKEVRKVSEASISLQLKKSKNY